MDMLALPCMHLTSKTTHGGFPSTKKLYGFDGKMSKKVKKKNCFQYFYNIAVFNYEPSLRSLCDYII